MFNPSAFPLLRRRAVGRAECHPTKFDWPMQRAAPLLSGRLARVGWTAWMQMRARHQSACRGISWAERSDNTVATNQQFALSRSECERGAPYLRYRVEFYSRWGGQLIVWRASLWHFRLHTSLDIDNDTDNTVLPLLIGVGLSISILSHTAALTRSDLA